MREKHRAVCNVCGSGNTHLMAMLRSDMDGEEYGATKCKSCGLLFASPIPELSFNSLQSVYGSDYTETLRELSASGRALEALREATGRQMDIVERYVPRGLALNVGAMSGAIQVLEERGWKLRLVEVSKYAAETARKRWGFDVTVSRIEDFDCPPNTFDFVKLGHVIEHLTDPKFALRRLASMLRPGGVLLVDTDNAGGLRTQIEVLVRRLLGERLSARLVRTLTKKNLRKRYGRLIPPVHLYSFSERSLTRLLEVTGFEVIEVFKPAWGDLTWFPLGDLDVFSAAERAFIRLDQLGARFGFGDVIAVLARKH